VTTAAPRADLTAVADWLSLLYEGTGGYINVVTSDDWAGRTFDVDKGPRGRVVDHIAGLDAEDPRGIYTRVTTLSSPPGYKKRGGEALTDSVPALWADIDIEGPGHRHAPCEGGDACEHRAENGRARHAGRVLPLPPDREAARAIVESAYLPPATLWVDSGGGMYPLWLLERPHRITDDLAEVAALSGRWQEMIAIAAARLGYHYGSGVGDLSRVLRVPGTWNRKTDDPRRCHVVENVGSRYTLQDLQDTLEQAQEALPVPTPVPRRPPRVRPGEDVRPGDDFMARVDWSDPLLLGGLGWRETYRNPDGERGWLRPGGHSQQSATTGRNGLDNLWVFSTATDFPTQEVISKLEAYRIIHGHATHKEATKALNALGFGSPPAVAANGKATPGSMEPFVWPDGAADAPPATASPNGTHGPVRAVDLPPSESPPDSAGQSGDPGREADAEEDEPEVDTWEPIDLGPYLRGEIVRSEPDRGLTRSDGVRMVYPGKEHAVIGEMEAGKTWWALACAAAEMLEQRHVIYIHFEEEDPGSTVERLQLMGCADNEILTYFHFVAPSQAIKPRQRKRLARSGAALVILDGVNEGMSLHKADIRDENGAAEFRRRIVKPFTKRGAAVINLDHVVKDSEARGRYALGSIHKGNALDGALIVLETMEAFGRGMCGKSAVYVVKDRPGFLRRHGRAVAKVPGKTFMGVFMVDDTRARQPDLDVKFWAPVDPEVVDQGEGDDTRSAEDQDDDRVMVAIRALADRGVPATVRHVLAEAGGNHTRVRYAIDRLVVGGKVVQVDGMGRSKPLFAADDPRLTAEGSAGSV
jgi:hypothetical protein